MLQSIHDGGKIGIESFNRPLLNPVILSELFDLSSHRGGLACQLDDQGVGAAAAIRARRSSRGGSRPGLGR